MNILMFEYASNGILCVLFPDIKKPVIDVEDAQIKKDGVTKCIQL